MTTLPQTTPMRLPRPGGAGQIAIPNAPLAGPLGAAGGAGGAGMTGADVWRVFRANLWLIVLMAIVGAVAGFFVNHYLAAHYPKYTASGLLRVQLPEEVFHGAVEFNPMPQNIELEQKSQAKNMVQPRLLLDVLTDSDKIRATTWFSEFKKDGHPDPESAKEDLLKNFSVQPIQNSRLIQVDMTYRIPQDARTVIEEIVERYINEQRNDKAAEWNEKSRNLRNALDGLNQQYKRISDQLTNSAAGNKDQFNTYSELEAIRMEVLRVGESQAMSDKEFRQAETELKSLQAMIDAGQTPPDIDAQVVQDPILLEYQKTVDALEGEQRQLGGPASPKAKTIQTSMDQARQKLQDRRDELKSALIDAKRTKLKTEYDVAQSERDAAKAKLDSVQQRFTDAQAAAARYKMMEEQQKTLKEKIDSNQAELDQIEKTKLPSSFSPVVWASKPPTPETPSFPKLPITMTVAIVLGLGVSIGIAFLREITDTSVRSPRDIARVGQLTMLGLIPHEDDDPQAADARLPLVIFDAPHSMAAEEFRKLRTRLQHAAALDSTRSILVSSANPGDGKTTVACNLAAGLALNGRRILLVDANFRRPDIHNLFEIANDKGFSDALNDLSTFDTVVRDTPVQNLFVMPTGPKPVNATELLESQLLIDFIERALEDYDHVIFDSGPLLIVSETMALAPRVDGVVTVVRARANSRGVLSRMRDMLRQVKAENLGVVLNAVRSTGGGYYGRNIKTYYAYQNGNGA